MKDDAVGMIEEVEARRRILAVTPRGEAQRVAVVDAGGRVAAETVTGRVDLPGFDNSAMDGYAVKAAEAKAGARLRVAGEQPAGRDLGLLLNSGEAIRIFTGAPLPKGADAVVMQEDVERLGEEIVIGEAGQAEVGEFVRRRGADVCSGQKLFAAGVRIGAARVALLASQGIAEVAVVARPRVAILSTGDELREPGVELRAGEIFNSNAAMLTALVDRFDGVVAGCWHARDEVAELRAKLAECFAAGDVVLVAGGVSVGERDLVKAELQAMGVHSDFWRVNVKPGKPFLFGRRGEQLVFGLPGNPVSAFITFLLFVAPALRRWSGGADLADDALPLPMIEIEAGEMLVNPGDRPHYVRGLIDADGRFVAVGMQQSHAIFGLSRAEALTRLSAQQTVESGGKLRVWRLDDV